MYFIFKCLNINRISQFQELFVEMIAKDALVYAQQGKRKTLQRKDLGKYRKGNWMQFKKSLIDVGQIIGLLTSTDLYISHMSNFFLPQTTQ